MTPSATLSFGCHNITGGSSMRRSLRLIHCAIDHGISRFDVAPSYGVGTAESTLGRALLNRSASVKVTTKFGIEPVRFGRIFAWAREPYRWLRRAYKLIDNAKQSERIREYSQLPKNVPAPLANVDKTAPYLGVRESLQRSLKALRLECVDTLLTHEGIDHERIAEHLAEIDLARREGLLEWFGCSGDRSVVDYNCSQFSNRVQVVQVSLSDAAHFSGPLRLRCFGCVRSLVSKIATRLQDDPRYRDELSSTMIGRKAVQERFALAAIVAAHTLFPSTTLVVSAGTEPHIADIVASLSDRQSLDWGMTYRDAHYAMLGA